MTIAFRARMQASRGYSSPWFTIPRHSHHRGFERRDVSDTLHAYVSGDLKRDLENAFENTFLQADACCQGELRGCPEKRARLASAGPPTSSSISSPQSVTE